jgi:hypothetical protein
LNVLNSDITVSGKHRIDEWEKGWGENLNKFKDSKNINATMDLNGKILMFYLMNNDWF